MAGVPSVEPVVTAPPPAKPASELPTASVSASPVTDAAASTPVADVVESAPAVASDPAKKDRKQRRERLPLPDPIPDTPVKRYPEPSKADLQANIDAENARLQACFERLNSTRAFYDQRQKIRDEGKPAFDEARKLFNQLNEQCRALFDAKKAITNQLKAIKEADIAARAASSSASSDIVGAGKDGNEAVKGLRTIEELEDRVEGLEYRLATESFAILEEKKIVAQISFLNHKGREYISERDQSFKDEKAAKEHRFSSRKELEEARKAQDAQIDAAKAKLEAQKKVVDAIRAEQELEIKKLQESTSDVDRDEEKKKIGEIKANIRKLRDDFQVELDKWYLNERIHYEQQKIAKKKKWEAQQAEREARRKAWEAEQAQYPEPDPYQAEKDMCTGLTVYMQTLLGETVDKPIAKLAPGKADNAPSLKGTSATREITAKGTAIGKSTKSVGSGFDDLAFSDFVKKSGKSKGKKGRRSSVAPAGGDVATETGDAALKPHSIDYLAAFTKLEIKPPNKISEVRAALEAVKAKKAFYDTAPPPSEDEKAKKAENKPKTQPSEKNAVAVDLMNGDGGAAAFPGLLPESGAPAVTRDVNLPSFKAVASGTASAPAPPMPMPADVPEMVNGDLPDMDTLGDAGMPTDSAVIDESIVAQPEPSLTEA